MILRTGQSVILGTFLLLDAAGQNAAPADRNAVNTAARPGGMMADSPVTFPKEGALPPKYPSDVRERSEPVEKDYFLFSTPCRSVAQINTIQADMPKGDFTAPAGDWEPLTRTSRILTQGGELRLMAVGDSIVNEAEYIRSAKVHPHLFYHDVVHANEYGEQILAKIMLAFWTAPELPEAAWLPDRLQWFQDQKFGFMMHWEPYSQWGCIESWPLVEEDKWARPDDLKPWVERGKDMARFTRDYWQLPKTFNPVKFNPRRWAVTAKAAGMKYVVFTTKHHDGFAMFDTRLSDYRITSPEVPFHANARSNVVREVFNAFRKQKFGIGAYFSKADWHCPDYWDPALPARTRNPNYDTLAQPEKWRRFVEFTYGQIEELMTGYGPIDILWLDAGQVRPPRQDIQMDRLVAMARQHQPRLIVVDRTVSGRYENYRTPEQEVPEKPLPYVWETCMTMGDQWSFKPHDNYKSTHKLIHLLVDIVGKGGNFLLNVGPQPDGELPAEAVQRMKEIGAWMKINGEAIYGSRCVAPYKEGQVVFTQKGRAVYAIYLTDQEGEGLPERVTFTALKPAPKSKIQLLGAKRPLTWTTAANGTTTIEIPAAIRQSPPCRHAFAFRFTLASN